MRVLPILAILAVFSSGCASRVPAVTTTQLRAVIQKHAHETVNAVSYAGTQERYHYIVHSRTLGRRTYRVLAAELPIEDTFAYSTVSTGWRRLRWDLQPLPERATPAITNLFRQIAK